MTDIFDKEEIRFAAEATDTAIVDKAFPALALARTRSPASLLDTISESRLVGKGGAGFPTYRKLALLQSQLSGERYLIVNGSEHEPGSLKDRFLLERHTETVIEGALILAHAAGVADVRVAVNENAEQAMRSAVAVVDTIAAAGHLRHAELSVKLVVAPVPDTYIAGEESALIAVLQGRPALPVRRPPLPIETGFNGAPTLVQNVETVAHLPFIIAAGAAAYRSLGTNGAGVTLCTFGSEFMRSGVQLIPLGINLRDVVYRHGGGLRGGKTIKAVQTGGPSSAFIMESDLDLGFTDEALKSVGSALGCATIRAFADDDDMVRALSETMEFFARNCCGQCPHCRMETQMLAAIMKQTLSRRGSQRLLQQIPVIIKANSDKGICGLIKMPGPPMLSALKYFEHEFDSYIP